MCSRAALRKRAGPGAAMPSETIAASISAKVCATPRPMSGGSPGSRAICVSENMPRTLRVAEFTSADRESITSACWRPGALRGLDNVAHPYLQHVLQLHRFQKARGRHHLADQHIDMPHRASLGNLDASRQGCRWQSRFRGCFCIIDHKQCANRVPDHNLVGFIDVCAGRNRDRHDATQVGHHVGCRRVCLYAQLGGLPLQAIGYAGPRS